MRRPILTLLRDKNTSIEEFRIAADQMATLLSYEASDTLEMAEKDVETPLGMAKGSVLKQGIVLVPILRSGMAMLPPFLKLFSASKVGFIGIRRDETTAQPFLYYKNLPKIGENDHVIILDPMIATGGSGGVAVEMLKAQKIPENHMTYVGIIAAPEGIDRLRKLAPGMKIICAEVDARLNDHKFIVPGLGDFGDRYFGTV